MLGTDFWVKVVPGNLRLVCTFAGIETIVANHLEMLFGNMKPLTLGKGAVGLIGYGAAGAQESEERVLLYYVETVVLNMSESVV